MIISELIKKYNLSVLSNFCNDKDYVFTCVSDKKNRIQKDFIYLPFSPKREDVFSLVEKALENPYCKGFVLNKAWFQSGELKNKFNDIMMRFSGKLEFAALANNIYNLAYSIAKDNSEKYKVKVVTVVGFEDITTVNDCLASSMSGVSLSYPQENWDVWQKSVETLLSADENLDWAIINVIPCRRHMLEYVGQYLKNHIIFTKISLTYMNIWESFETLSDELSKLTDNLKNIKAVYNFESNEIVDSVISYKLQDKYSVVKTSSSSSEDESLTRCYALACKFLRDFGFKPGEFSLGNNFYNEYILNGRKVFKLDKDKICFNSVKEALGVFFNKYDSDKSVIILEHITGLGEYKENAYEELLSSIADYSPNILVLIDTKAYIHFFKRKNRTTYLKYFKYDPNDIKIFLDGMLSKNSVIFLASTRGLPFLECEAKND